MRADWPRYVFASIADYFKTAAGSLPVMVEGLDERTETFMRATDRAEVRITGPVIRELSKDYHLLYVDVSVLLVSRYDGTKNPYDIVRYAGVFSDAMESSIAVWNFGGQPGDYDEEDPQTQVFLGCLSLRPGTSVLVEHYGQVDRVEKVKMSEVTAKYAMEIQD